MPEKTPQSGGKPASHGILNLGRYILQRGIIILLTIIIGVYVTVIVANKGGQVDEGVRIQIEEQLAYMRYNRLIEGSNEDERTAEIVRIRGELVEASGLSLPPALRNLRWTLNALTFGWGKVVFWVTTRMQSPTQGLYNVGEIIRHYLPNTVLIIGSAYLILFTAGIPLALFMASRKRNNWLDRLVTMLSPISSVPSWVHGVILVMIFAIQFRLLPYGGKYDILPAETMVDNALIVGRHMILPVLAVLLGMFFHLVYSWRTYFMIYTEEDYVDLAKAKGLHPNHIERRYILRPALPFVITSFALTLVGFWQMTVALEEIFHWPGIGQLYISALPKYMDDFFYPGDMGIILSIVVIFAFLLGFTVFILDIVYAWVDPRIRLGTSGYTIRSAARKSWWQKLIGSWNKTTSTNRFTANRLAKNDRTVRQRANILISNIRLNLKNNLAAMRRTMREVLRYPSAIIGLLMISVLVIGSLFAVFALPYKEIGEEWRSSGLTGKLTVPKNVPATWFNLFRRHKLPTTITLSSAQGTISKVIHPPQDGIQQIDFNLEFDYPYQGFPQDILLHISSRYEQKRPHLTISWTTPDGRELYPKSPSLESENTYLFSEYLDSRLYVMKNPAWKDWFVTRGQNRTPEFYALFADPQAEEPIALPGNYHLNISVLGFEPDTNVDIEFVLLGQVYGLAGTDYLRRDLLVPLLWGLPFALAFGLVGATLITIFAMIIAAVGVWFGGWVDNLIQRLTEVTMIIPILAVGVLLYALYDISLWTVLIIVVVFFAFSSPTKAFRAALIQVKEAPYIEAAHAYGASNSRIIFKYMIPVIIPVLIPQLVTLIPAMVFLEATLGIMNVYDPRFPTWGRVIYEALRENALWGGYPYWVLEPIALLLLTGLAFSLLGFALERVLNPRLLEE